MSWDLWLYRAIGAIIICAGIGVGVWLAITGPVREWPLALLFYMPTPVGLGVVILLATEAVIEIRNLRA